MKFFPLIAFLFFSSCGFHKPEIVTLPRSSDRGDRILFIAVDGIGYDMIAELKREGYFKDFRPPVPLIVTFPSATTTAFTGLFQPLGAGKVPGYETRFFSYDENRMKGGTPWDIYKIPIPYKHYFDSFRHTMYEKGIMYSFPGVAGREDLERTEKLALQSPKKVLMTYLGGTDGAQHLLGKTRMGRFMKYMDRFLIRMKKRYARAGREPLKIVMFSDHGFHFGRLKTVSSGDVAKSLKKFNLTVNSHLKKPTDVVLVEYGLLNAGVIAATKPNREPAARALAEVPGVDLAFWPRGSRVYVINSHGEEGYFEYRGSSEYRYMTVQGDPLNLKEVIGRSGRSVGEWIGDKNWFNMTWNHYYPDPGKRLYDAFHQLVKNEAGALFSMKPDYQFGGFAALAGTYLKFGHKGTHGAFFWGPSAGVVLTDDPHIQLPKAIRYDQFFGLFIPKIVQAYKVESSKILDP